jgi:hypothetical protein
MGHKFYGRDGVKQEFYEDRQMARATVFMLAGNLHPKKWVERLQKHHDKCNTRYFGYKHPNMSLLRPSQWEDIDPLLVIHAKRPRDQCVYSMRTWVPGVVKDKARAEHFYDNRMGKLMKSLPHLPHITIEYNTNERRSDWEIESMIKTLSFVEGYSIW